MTDRELRRVLQMKGHNVLQSSSNSSKKKSNLIWILIILILIGVYFYYNPSSFELFLDYFN